MTKVKELSWKLHTLLNEGLVISDIQTNQERFLEREQEFCSPRTKYSQYKRQLAEMLEADVYIIESCV